MLASLLSLPCLVGLLGSGGFDEDPGKPIPHALPPSSAVDDSGQPAVDTAVQRALQSGLRFLAERQAQSLDGSMSTADAKNPAILGVTALSALAFMAGGNTPTRGPQSHALQRTLEYLVDKSNQAPATPNFGYISTSGDDVSKTHGHGFATLALAEAYGMGGRSSERIRQALVAAVACIQNSQGPEGGWEYESILSANHEGSVTICYVQALRAARNAGIVVDHKVIERAEAYVLRLQKENGEFRYKLDQEDSSIALTAASISTLNMAGRYDNAVIQTAIDAIWSGLSLQSESHPSGRQKPTPWPYYQRLYIAQAFWQLSDGSHFKRWFKDERTLLLRQQKRDGSWNSLSYGAAYATAMNCLVLGIPEGVLPIFQR